MSTRTYEQVLQRARARVCVCIYIYIYIYIYISVCVHMYKCVCRYEYTHMNVRGINRIWFCLISRSRQVDATTEKVLSSRLVGKSHSFLEFQRAVPKVLTYLGGARFVAWHLSRPSKKCRDIFVPARYVWATVLRLDPLKNQPSAIIAR